MTLVSVIIPTRNRSAFLKQAIESVLAVQCDDFELEVLIVDDGSVDDTADVVRRYPVVYLPQKGGLGPAGTRNVGVDAARGEYIAFLDDDDLWLPTNLAPQLRVLREHSEYALVFAQMWFFMTSPDEERSLLYRPDIERPEYTMIDLLDFAPQLGTVVARRSMIQHYRFDASLPMGEDWDWVLRISKDHLVGYAPVPVALLRRNRPDHKVSWEMVRYSTKVFHRRVRVFDWRTRLRLQPVLWKRRSMYSGQYIEKARTYARERAYLQVIKALGCAVWSSPGRVAVMPVRFLRRKLVRYPVEPAA